KISLSGSTQDRQQARGGVLKFAGDDRAQERGGGAVVDVHLGEVPNQTRVAVEYDDPVAGRAADELRVVVVVDIIRTRPECEYVACSLVGLFRVDTRPDRLESLAYFAGRFAEALDQDFEVAPDEARVVFFADFVLDRQESVVPLSFDFFGNVVGEQLV